MKPIWKDRIAIHTGLFGILLMAIYLLLYFEMDGTADFGVTKFLKQTSLGKSIWFLIIIVCGPVFLVGVAPYIIYPSAGQELIIILPLVFQGLIYLGIGRLISIGIHKIRKKETIKT